MYFHQYAGTTKWFGKVVKDFFEKWLHKRNLSGLRTHANKNFEVNFEQQKFEIPSIFFSKHICVEVFECIFIIVNLSCKCAKWA